MPELKRFFCFAVVPKSKIKMLISCYQHHRVALKDFHHKKIQFLFLVQKLQRILLWLSEIQLSLKPDKSCSPQCARRPQGNGMKDDKRSWVDGCRGVTWFLALLQRRHVPRWNLDLFAKNLMDLTKNRSWWYCAGWPVESLILTISRQSIFCLNSR